MIDRDDEQTPNAPEEGPEAAESEGGPSPATWAGRQRSSSEDAGEHPQLSEDEPSEDGDEQPEASEDGDEEPQASEVEPSDESEEPSENGDEPSDADEESEPDEETGPDTEERLAQNTVETDTLALGDREAAREAALAGLKARAAENKTKHGTGAITSPPPPKAPAPPEAEAQAADEPPSEPQPVAVAAGAEDEGPPSGRGIWARFAVGSLLIIVAMATATALSLFFFFNGVLHGFHGLPGVQNELAVANPGSPQTVLILGSDERPEDQAIGARSDTTILLRIAADQITVMSIPRDLRVNIPGHGIDKFNAAYSLGGPKLTLKTVKQVTGIQDINHVVNVNFTGFANAVNAIGCVYVDVDHHYYHSNVGLAPIDQYSEIDVPAGYQRMCGNKALAYVRYRHDDNDLVRSARQQEFLREMRQELPAGTIASDYEKLKNILQQYVTLDIQNTSDLLSLAQLIVAANGAPVVQVHFPAQLGGPNAIYVTASDSAIRAAVAKFEGQTPTTVPGTTSTTSSSNGGSGGGSKKGSSGSGGGGGSGSGGSSSAPAPPAPTLIDASSSGQQIASQLANTKKKDGKPMVDFPIYYPTKLIPGSAILGPDLTPSESDAFVIDGPGSEVYHGYKFVVQVASDGYEAYYGMSGTDWPDPPILDHPDETRTINGTDYLLSWDGPQLRLIGWKTDHGSYWIDNTLLNVLTPGQMFAIAESMQKYTG
jgi:polyisoprenyl-teichoic acid--peptidoglycan teichoic acid transferase